MKVAAALEPGGSVALDDYPAGCAWLADGRACCVAGAEGALHRVARDGNTVRAEKLGEHPGGIAAVAAQSSGTRVATAGQDGSVLLWDAAAAGVAPVALRAGGGFPAALAFAGHGRLLAAAAGRTVSLWNADGVALAQQPAAADHGIAALAWRPAVGGAKQAGSELAAIGQGEMTLHRCEPALTSSRQPWARGTLLAAWSPDGKVLAAGLQEGTVFFRNVAAAKQSQMSGYAGKLTHLTWGANARHLASACAGNNDVVIWDFAGRGPEGTTPLELKGHSERIEALAFQPKGKLLVSGGRDWRLCLWLPGASPLPLDVQLVDGEIATLAWSPDGSALLVAERSGKITLYAVR